MVAAVESPSQPDKKAKKRAKDQPPA